MQIFLSLCSSVSRKISALFCGCSPRDAAIVMLSGQVADGLMTILAGEMIDRFGQFKLWHIEGSILDVKLQSLPCQYDKKQPRELLQVIGTSCCSIQLCGSPLSFCFMVFSHGAMACRSSGSAAGSDPNKKKRSEGVNPWLYEVFTSQFETVDMAVRMFVPITVLQNHNQYNILQAVICDDLTGLYYLFMNYCSDSGNGKKSRSETEQIALQDQEGVEPNREASVYDHLDKFVRNLSDKTAASGSEPKLPLVRVKADYSGFSTIIPQRFGQKYIGKV
ncbi:hypothetical protein ABZP36_008286 [Zizania latifolia]